MSKLGILVCFPNPIVIMNHHGQMSCLFDDALPALGACSRYFVVERGTKSCQKVGKLFGVNCGYFGEAMFPLPKSISSKLRGETARLYTSVASSCYISSLRQPPRGTKPRAAHDQKLSMTAFLTSMCTWAVISQPIMAILLLRVMSATPMRISEHQSECFLSSDGCDARVHLSESSLHQSGALFFADMLAYC